MNLISNKRLVNKYFLYLHLAQLHVGIIASNKMLKICYTFVELGHTRNKLRPKILLMRTKLSRMLRNINEKKTGSIRKYWKCYCSQRATPTAVRQFYCVTLLSLKFLTASRLSILFIFSIQIVMTPDAKCRVSWYQVRNGNGKDMGRGYWIWMCILL